MKTFKPETVQRVIWFTADGKSHVLLKAKGRGWFVDTDTRNVDVKKPPSRRAIIACITDPMESNFEPCLAKEFKF